MANSGPPKPVYPHDWDTEKALLGAMILENRIYPGTSLDLFDNRQHKDVFELMAGQRTEGKGIDLVSLFGACKERPSLIALIAELPNHCPSIEAAAAWLRCLKEIKYKRALFFWSVRVKEAAQSGDWEGLAALQKSAPKPEEEPTSEPKASIGGGFPEIGAPETEVRRAIRGLENRGASPRVRADEVLRTDGRWQKMIWWDDFQKRRKLGDRSYQDADDQRISIWLSRVYRLEVAPDATSRIVAAIAADNVRDPLGDYLNSLAWDGKARLDGWLETGLGVAPSALCSILGKRWCIQAVARALSPGCKADATLVLTGAQGALKSSALRTLVGAEFFSDSPILLGEVRGIQQAHAAWAHELSELASLRGRAVEDVKAFLTTRTDTFIPLHGRQPVTWPRRCCFCGTTNEDTFLADPTGARRFWPVRVGVVDLAWIKANRDQLWAEAVHRFRAGEPWYLDQIQEEELTEKREEFQREDLWDHRIENWVNSQDVSGKFWVEGRKLDREVLSAGRVLELAIGIRPCDQRDGQAEKVGRILKKLGWTRFRKRIGGLVLSYLIPPGGNGNEV